MIGLQLPGGSDASAAPAAGRRDPRSNLASVLPLALSHVTARWEPGARPGARPSGGRRRHVTPGPGAAATVTVTVLRLAR